MTAISELLTDNIGSWIEAVKPKASTGRGAESSAEYYGVKKLRELILNLAVRGMLVPQSDEDEAVEVVERQINAQWEELVGAGVLSKGKVPAETIQVPHPYEIPSNWLWMNFQRVFRPISVGARKIKTSEMLEAGDLPVVDQGQSYIAGYTNQTELEIELDGPVIVFGDHTTALKYIDFNFVAGADGVKILRPLVVFEKYFFMVSQALPIESRGYGRHYARFIANSFPLPPLAEQHRIVAKVDELMALCDKLEAQQADAIEAHKTLVTTILDALTTATEKESFDTAWARIAEHFDILFTTEWSVDQLKQSILQLALMGKLVPQVNDDRVADFTASAQELPFKLPAGWTSMHLGDLGEILGGGTPSKSNTKYWGGKIPWVSPKDMKRARIQITQDSITPLALAETSVKEVPENSLLMVVRGMILAHSFPVAISGGTVTLNQDMKAIAFTGHDPTFILMMMMGRKRDIVALVERSSHGTCKLVSQRLFATPIALPPLVEQHSIVAKASELLAMCDQLRSAIGESEKTQLLLADAITEQAIA